MSYLEQLIEERNRANKAARDIVDTALTEKRALTAEDNEAIARADADYDAKQALIDEIRKAEQRDLAAAAELANMPETRTVPEPSAPQESTADVLRKLATGELRSYTFEAAEHRANSTTGTVGGYTVPQGFGGRIIEKMLTVGPALNSNVVNLISTSHMRDIPFPIENARATGTATAEGATYDVSTPTFTQKTLKAYKYGTIVLSSEELLASEDVGVLDYLARNMGVAVGTAVNSILTLGTGTVQPEGVSAGAGSAVTGGTGVAGVPTYANLVDLIHAVDSLYAHNAKFMLNRTTLGKIRQVTDTAGHYIFVPSAVASAPNTILGYEIVENPYVASAATNAISVLFGDFDYWLVRQSGGIELSRTDDRYWDSDQVGLKVRTWVDSFVGQSTAIKYYKGGTA